ncbi:MAG: GIY-YIG nuclease family protein [Oscillospiraceae bacterium]|nr:GIY-YIG nuclease family protein [Oscillospiraceae bacterium]
MYGKTVELFFVNGINDGLVTATLSNWNGGAVKILRNDIPSFSADQIDIDISGSGVYFLFGKEDNGKEYVYIGESTQVLTRLKQHLHDYASDKEKFYWNCAVIFVGVNLDKSTTLYLENKLCAIANDCQRYGIWTKNTNTSQKLKKSKENEMDEFIENMKVILLAMNYYVLVPMPQTTMQTTYFYCKNKNGANAKMFISQNGFTVLKGSAVSDKESSSFHTINYAALYESLVNQGVIENNVFTQDYEFSSPSAASAVVKRTPSNGKQDWITDSNEPLALHL